MVLLCYEVIIMKFGVCNNFDNAQKIKDADFDYIEVNLTKLSLLTDGEFLQKVQLLKQIGLEAKTANCFFSSDILLVGQNVDYDKIKQYTEFALKRAHTLGVEVAVLGSGKSRSVPEGYDRDVATEQFKKAVTICSDVAKKYGIKIAIEALSQRDTNFLNTVSETAEVCKDLGLDNVGITADFFHIHMNDEGLDGFKNEGKHIFHLHIAKPDASRMPPSVEDADTLKTWAESAKAIGYDGCLSLECTSKADIDSALKDMNSIKYIFE